MTTAEKFSIYYMRLLAIVLIINSHFNKSHISNFDQLYLYGYLGFFGNMIFFFISSYVLAIGFEKYIGRSIRWVLYRLFYISFIIISLRTMFYAMDGTAINFIDMLELRDLSFVSMMLILSAFFPIFFIMPPSGRKTVCILILLLSFTEPFTTLIDNIVIAKLSYVFMFMFGIMLANREIKITSSLKINLIFLVLFLFIFMVTSVVFSSDIVNFLAKIALVYFIFSFLESSRLVGRFALIDNFVKKISTLSLYMYITHFYFIEIAYKLNPHLGLFIIFLILTPICYFESFLLDPIVKRSRNIFFLKTEKTHS